MRKLSTRRKFLAGLGLGTASPLLTSIAGSLVGEAIAQTSGARFKHLFMFTGANGMLERFTACKTRGERDFDLAPIAAPIPYEGMAVAGRGARSEIDVIDCLAGSL